MSLLIYEREAILCLCCVCVSVCVSLCVVVCVCMCVRVCVCVLIWIGQLLKGCLSDYVSFIIPLPSSTGML